MTYAPTSAVPCRLAAIVFHRDEDPDAPLKAFVAALQKQGVRVGGLIQQHDDADGCALEDVSVLNIVTGELIPVMQDLGRDATGCRVDPAAIAAAAGELARAIATHPDLVVVNRFGKLEAEGGGMIHEIGEAVADGAPLIVCVPARFLRDWNAFAGGLDEQLPPRREAIEAWWAGVEARDLAAARPLHPELVEGAGEDRRVLSGV